LLPSSSALSLAATASDVGVDKEYDDNQDVDQDDKESLHAPKPPRELPELYPVTILPRKRRHSNGRWQ
jgi:hypothetical protein